MRRFLSYLGVLIVLAGSSFVLGSGVPGALAGARVERLADHPLTGNWLANVKAPGPNGQWTTVPSTFGADGSVVMVFPTSQVGLNGVQYSGAAIGVWEAAWPRTGHFTVVRVMSDAKGTFLGTLTIDGYPTVGADGMTFLDKSADSHVTVRDASRSIIKVIAQSQPVSATRMGLGSLGTSSPYWVGYPLCN